MKKTFIFVTNFFLAFPMFTLAHTEDTYSDGGSFHMMDWHMGNGVGMMGGGVFGFFALLTWLVWLVVGILAVVWLWQDINRK
ncbi:MAG: hypothetical protein WDZ40_02485 [Candidatus Spechtbacterales bacterium]